MACPEFDSWILESVEGALPGGDQSRLDRHLESCGDCRAFRESLGILDTALTAQLRPPSLPVDFRRRLMRRVSAAAREKTPSMLPELLDFAGIAAVAVAGGFLLQSLVGLAAARRLFDGGNAVVVWAAPAACAALCAWFALGTCPDGWRQRKNWPM